MAWPVSTQGGEVNGVAISGDGSVVVAGTLYFQGPVPATLGTYAYDENGNERWKDVAAPATTAAALDGGVYWVAVSRDGKWAASGGGNHQVPPKPTPGLGYLNAYYVPTATGDKQVLLNGSIGGVNAVALSGDGTYLVAGADAAYIFERAGNTFAQFQKRQEGLSSAEPQNVVAVAISDDGQSVVYGTSAQPPRAGGVANTTHVVLYSPMLTAVPVVWNAPAGHIIKWVAMAADGSGFAVVTTDRPNVGAALAVCSAHFFTLNSSSPSYFVSTNAPMWTWPLAGCNGVMFVAINGDGSRVAAIANVPKPGGTKGAVFFFNTESGAQLWQEETSHGPNSVSVDAVGKLVAVADGFGTPTGDFYLFDAASHALLPLPTHPNAISWTIQVSADGTAIAAGTDDAKVYRFELAPTGPPAAPTNVRILP